MGELGGEHDIQRRTLNGLAESVTLAARGGSTAWKKRQAGCSVAGRRPGMTRRLMSLSIDDVAKVAVLARLRVSPDELQMFTGQLNSIMDYVAELQELDTDGVLPLAHGIEVRTVFRDDVRGPALSREAALANAPKRNQESFLVPAVLE
jgi:aspartyl-tRNA(Asn)/glutamyl-tRNA(Gln) amidotransferase subunit C